MKKLKTCLILFLGAMLITSCSSDDNDGTNKSLNNTDGNWKLGNFEYSLGTSNQKTDNGTTAIVASTILDNSNGSASGSAVTFAFNDLGEGTYTIVENIAKIAYQDMQVIQLSCTIGTGVDPTNASRYDTTSATSGTVIITQQGGVYKVSVPKEVTLFKTVNLGDGVPNTEESYSFTANNIQ